MVLLDLCQLFQESLVPKKLDPSDDGGIDVDQRLHGCNQERGRPAGRVQQAQIRKNIIKQKLAERCIQVDKEIADLIEAAGRALGILVHAVEDKLVNRALT